MNTIIALRKFSGPADLAQAAAADWLKFLDAVFPRQLTIALSGGRITRDFFSETVRQYRELPADRKNRPLFDRVHFFWADERCVPPDDPESNFRLAKEMLLDPLQIPHDRIHRLRGEGPEDAAVQEAIRELTQTAPPAQPGGPPVLDLAFLGMGENGHTASLFPGESDATMNDPAIFRLVTADKPPPRRITMGYGVLAAARDAWVIISGKGKEPAMRDTLASGIKTPLARLINLRTQTRLYTDVT